MENYVVIVRHPDAENDITTFGNVKAFDYDLGSSFDGSPADEETAFDWIPGGEDGPTELDEIPIDHPVYRKVLDLYYEVVGDFDACREVLEAYERRRGSLPTPPTRPWRTIRGAGANYKVAFYTSKERRDAAAQRWADRDGETVMAEMWDPEIAERCDPANQGWGCDAVFHPKK